MDAAEQVRMLLLVLPGLLLSITIHEFAHARVALAFGDDTAALLGRVSLNPLRHLEPVGAILLLLTALGYAPIGWGKPVPVNPYNLRPRRLGDIMVSLAGPASNVLFAILALLLLKGWLVAFRAGLGAGTLGEAVAHALLVLLLMNVSLAVFNLIPLFPLDGHHILRELLSPDKAEGFMDWQMRYGRWALLLLLAGPWLLGRGPNPIGSVLGAAQEWVLRLI